IRGMQMLVVPLVFCSIVCGAAAIGDTKTLGKVGLKTVMFYMATTVLAVTLALGVASVVNPGKGANLAKMMTAAKAAGSTVGKTTTSTSAVDTILNIIPTNPIQALANGNMLAIIFFALLIGIILAKLGERVQLMTNFFSQGNDIMMEMTMMVMKVAPIAVYCLIARTFSSMGFSVIIYMLKYVVAVLIALLLQGFGGYQILLFIFTRLNPLKFIKKFFPVMAFAFSTATSNATIPLSIETLEEKLGVSRKISSFTIPLGATVNMDGTSIMQGVAVVFVAQAYGITLTPMNMLTVIATATLASIGTAGVPSVGLITLTMVFNSVGLPAAGITLIMGIDRILDMARTAINITGDAICTTIVAYQNNELDKALYNKPIPND
ncbi:MAG: dicarboxylate/amino acid:cation symporter, partial [Sharpea porci]